MRPGRMPQITRYIFNARNATVLGYANNISWIVGHLRVKNPDVRHGELNLLVFFAEFVLYWPIKNKG